MVFTVRVKKKNPSYNAKATSEKSLHRRGSRRARVVLLGPHFRLVTFCVFMLRPGLLSTQRRIVVMQHLYSSSDTALLKKFFFSLDLYMSEHGHLRFRADYDRVLAIEPSPYRDSLQQT